VTSGFDGRIQETGFSFAARKVESQSRSLEVEVEVEVEVQLLVFAVVDQFLHDVRM
jgi:hypothetical protein